MCFCLHLSCKQKSLYEILRRTVAWIFTHNTTSNLFSRCFWPMRWHRIASCCCGVFFSLLLHLFYRTTSSVLAPLPTVRTRNRQILKYNEPASSEESFRFCRLAACCFGFGSFVSPLYSIVSRQTGNTFLLKLFCTKKFKSTEWMLHRTSQSIAELLFFPFPGHSTCISTWWVQATLSDSITAPFQTWLFHENAVLVVSIACQSLHILLIVLLSPYWC